MADRIPPDGERLARLIHEAYETMPGPDMARLHVLEERLIRNAGVRVRPKRSRPVWWLILLLAGGTAVAAWWSGYFSSGPGRQPVPASQPARQEPRPIPEKVEQTIPRDKQSDRDKQDSPVIYRRESF